MSQEMTSKDGCQSQQTLYAASTGSETSGDDLSEASDAAVPGSTFILTGRKRRRRTIIAADQLLKMEQLYKAEQWPGREKKEALARDIGMSSHFVNIWFQNKRSRMKKLAQEEEELALLRQTKSPGAEKTKLDPALAQGRSACPRPIAIAPKPPGGQSTLMASNMSPGAKVQTPKLDSVQIGQCLVVGQNINVSSNGETAASSYLPSSPTVKLLTNTTATTTGPNCSKIESFPAQKPSLTEQAQSPQVTPACNHAHQPPPPRQQGMNFFKCLVCMMAMEEGGLLKRDDPEFDVAVNAALYGLRLANGNILTYKKRDGLLVHNDQHSD